MPARSSARWSSAKRPASAISANSALATCVARSKSMNSFVNLEPPKLPERRWLAQLTQLLELTQVGSRWIDRPTRTPPDAQSQPSGSRIACGV